MLDLFKTKKPKVVPRFLPLYQRIENIALSENGVNGKIKQLKAMIETITKDEDFKALCGLSGRSLIQSTNTYSADLNSLRVDKQGGFYLDFSVEDTPIYKKDIEDIVNTFRRGVITPETVKKGFLDYVRFAPYE